MNPAASRSWTLNCQCFVTTEAWLMPPASEWDGIYHLENPWRSVWTCIIRHGKVKLEVKIVLNVFSCSLFWYVYVLKETILRKIGYPCFFSTLLETKYCDSVLISRATLNYSSSDLSNTLDSSSLVLLTGLTWLTFEGQIEMEREGMLKSVNFTMFKKYPLLLCSKACISKENWND